MCANICLDLGRIDGHTGTLANSGSSTLFRIKNLPVARCDVKVQTNNIQGSRRLKIIELFRIVQYYMYVGKLISVVLGWLF